MTLSPLKVRFKQSTTKKERKYLTVASFVFKWYLSRFANKTRIKEFSLRPLMNEIRFSSPLRLLFRLTPRKIADRKLGYKNKLKISGQFSPSKKSHFENHSYLSWYGGIRDALFSIVQVRFWDKIILMKNIRWLICQNNCQKPCNFCNVLRQYDDHPYVAGRC